MIFGTVLDSLESTNFDDRIILSFSFSILSSSLTLNLSFVRAGKDEQIQTILHYARLN